MGGCRTCGQQYVKPIGPNASSTSIAVEPYRFDISKQQSRAVRRLKHSQLNSPMAASAEELTSNENVE